MAFLLSRYAGDMPGDGVGVSKSSGERKMNRAPSRYITRQDTRAQSRSENGNQVVTSFMMVLSTIATPIKLRVWLYTKTCNAMVLPFQVLIMILMPYPSTERSYEIIRESLILRSMTYCAGYWTSGYTATMT